MGDSSTCLMQPLSYASVLSPAEAIEGNPIHALGQSVSFGRFTSESLSWEKWSTFSHKQYVEEAERYSRPGSVAQKKAFFEAHYKKIAEKKKAEAALLEQANATAGYAPGSGEVPDTSNSTLENMDIEKDLEPNEEVQTQIASPHSVSKMDKTEVHSKEGNVMELDKDHKSPQKSSVPESKDEGFIAMNSETPWKWLKPLNFTPVRELNLLSSEVQKKVDDSHMDGSHPDISKDCSTPLKTPIAVPKGTSALGTPRSEHQVCAKTDLLRTMKNDNADKSIAVTKRFSLATECSRLLNTFKRKLQSPRKSTPIRLRTEERATRRRENLKDKFDEEDAQNVLPKTKLKEIPEKESRKWHPTFCFTTTTLPADHKEMRRTEDLMKKIPTSRQPLKSRRKPETGALQEVPLPSKTTSTKTKGIQEVSRKKFSDHVPISCSRECNYGSCERSSEYPASMEEGRVQ